MMKQGKHVTSAVAGEVAVVVKKIIYFLKHTFTRSSVFFLSNQAMYHLLMTDAENEFDKICQTILTCRFS